MSPVFTLELYAASVASTGNQFVALQICADTWLPQVMLICVVRSSGHCSELHVKKSFALEPSQSLGWSGCCILLRSETFM